jgi:N-acetylglucosamine-6-phosphate deacetylase
MLLRNCHTVLPDRVEDNLMLQIENSRIVRLARSEESLTDSREISLEGLTVFPGFIDIHIHGSKGIDTLEASVEELKEVSEFLATQGVTSWLPTFVPAADQQYRKAIAEIDKIVSQQREAERESTATQPAAARVIGVHYEGPFVNELQCGALHRQYFKTFSSPADIETLPVPGADALVKMMTLAPETAGGVELVSELVRRNWVVSLGHTRADVETLDRAAAAGARHMTHFMNAMAPLHHRSPGPIGWGLLHEDVTCDFIADGIHLDPVVLKLLLRLKGAERLSLISDAIAATGMGDGSYEIWGETIRVTAGRTSNSQGSIAGSVISMTDGLRKMRSLGASEVELGLMAATNPAKLLNIAGECGSIAVGKRADLVALDAEAQVKLTIVGGEVVFSQL